MSLLRVASLEQKTLLSLSKLGASSILIKRPNIRIEDAPAAKSLQSCPTLCDFIDGSPPGKNPSALITSEITKISGDLCQELGTIPTSIFHHLTGDIKL